MEKYSVANHKGKLILVATILASGMAFLDGTVVNIAIPTIQSKLNATISDIQWVLNSYVLMLAALMLISGALGDRFGRKRIFIYGIVVFTIASIICALSQTILQLILARTLEGIGAAMMMPGSLSIIDASFAENERGKAIGIWSGFSGGVAALGPLLGGILVQIFGWESIFFINVPLAILTLVITHKYVPESKNEQATKLDIAGAVTILFSLLGLSYGLMYGPEVGWLNIFVVISLLFGLLLLVFFVFIERKVSQPLLPFAIFKSKLVTGSNIVTLLLYFAFNGLLLFLVLDIQQVQHYSPFIAGLSMLPPIVLLTFLSGKAGEIADRIGPRKPMIVGPLIVGISMIYLMFLGRNANYLLQILPATILFGIGMTLTIPALTKSALHVNKKFSGAASGVNNAVARVAALVAVALLGGLSVILFSNHLANSIQSSKLNTLERQIIMTQTNKLGAITIPDTFSMQQKIETQEMIEKSFDYSFKWIMAINAFFAVLSAIVSFFTIFKEKNIVST